MICIERRKRNRTERNKMSQEEEVKEQNVADPSWIRDSIFAIKGHPSNMR